MVERDRERRVGECVGAGKVQANIYAPHMHAGGRVLGPARTHTDVLWPRSLCLPLSCARALSLARSLARARSLFVAEWHSEQFNSQWHRDTDVCDQEGLGVSMVSGRCVYGVSMVSASMFTCRVLLC